MAWLNVGVKGNAAWPTQETVIKFDGHDFVLKPATSDTEQSVHVNLQGMSDTEALTVINRFLSILSWCDDQSMHNLYGWSGNPRPVAVPKQRRETGSSIAFSFARDIEPDERACRALAIFREGKSAASIPFEFLSYFKILNIFWNDRTDSVTKQNQIVEGIRLMLPKLKDQRASSRIQTLQTTEPDAPKYLYKSGRCAIAHAYADPVVDPDDASDLRRLSADLPIVKAIAEYLIEHDLGVSRSILG